MATQPDRRTYLFLLQQPTAAARQEAYSRLREMGLLVPIQHGNQALEVVATVDEAGAAFATGLFGASLKGSLAKEDLQKLTPEQTQVVEQWNERFTESGRKAAKSRTHEGKSWGAEGFMPPAPYTTISPEVFDHVLERHGIKLGKAQEASPLEGAAFEEFERKLIAQYDDPQLAGNLARLALRLPPEYRQAMLNLPPAAVTELGAQGQSRGKGAK